ncbi:MAG TPA: IS1380 family transposase [Bryobacteraceae bacterium]|nr:IS1380 family transposase [Bryobacteraceae bacterium]
MTDCIETQLGFSFYRLQPLTAAFDGGCITSEAGLLVLREFDQRHALSTRLATALADERDPSRTQHTAEALLRQRVYQIVAGYEDGNDANHLRHDATFQLLSERAPGEALASQPTFSRLENSFRWRDWVALNRLLLEWFVQLCRARIAAAGEIVLDIDSSADPTYGQQEFSFYNGAYDRRIYHPLFVFERGTGYLLAAHLRRGGVNSSPGALPVLRRLLRFLRRHFPHTPVRLVGDAGFATPTLYDFCEREKIQYGFGIGSNPVFQRKSMAVAEKAKRRWLRHQHPQVLYSGFRHRGTRWRKHSRRICVKAEHGSGGSSLRFLITNRCGPAAEVFAFYQGRGECENRIEELKNGFAADRLSCHRFLANAFRLLLHAAAYNLVVLFRHRLPEPLRHAQIETLRVRLFKLGALVVRSARRILLHCATGWPSQTLFQQVHHAVASG